MVPLLSASEWSNGGNAFLQNIIGMDNVSLRDCGPVELILNAIACYSQDFYEGPGRASTRNYIGFGVTLDKANWRSPGSGPTIRAVIYEQEEYWSPWAETYCTSFADTNNLRPYTPTLRNAFASNLASMPAGLKTCVMNPVKPNIQFTDGQVMYDASYESPPVSTSWNERLLAQYAAEGGTENYGGLATMGFNINTNTAKITAAPGSFNHWFLTNQQCATPTETSCAARLITINPDNISVDTLFAEKPC